MKIFNINGNEPNILHSPGWERYFYENILFDVLDEGYLEIPEDLTIVYCETDYEQYLEDAQPNKKLLWQINNYNLRAINGFIEGYYKEGENFVLDDKIYFWLNGLKQVTTKYALLLDSRDMKILNFNNIIEKFLSYNTRILFSAEKIEYPVRDIFIRQERGQDTGGSNMRFINTGGVIGYTEDLLTFYEMAYDRYLNNGLQFGQFYNPQTNELLPWYKSDQGTITDMIGEKQYDFDYINLDFKSKIFLTTSNTNIYLN